MFLIIIIRGIDRIRKRFRLVRKSKVIRGNRQIRDTAIIRASHLFPRSVYPDIGYRLTGQALRLQEEISHDQMPVRRGMYTILPAQGIHGIRRLLPLVDRYHRAVEIHESPLILPGTGIQEIHDLQDRRILPRERALIETGSLVIRRTSDQDFPHLRILLIDLLDKSIIPTSFLYPVPGDRIGPRLPKIHIADIVHAKR